MVTFNIPGIVVLKKPKLDVWRLCSLPEDSEKSTKIHAQVKKLSDLCPNNI
jgi:hypothetical protein